MRSRSKSQLVYISGPITDRLNHSIPFEEARGWLKNDGHQVLSPLDIAPPSERESKWSAPLTQEEIWCYYMKEAVKMLVQADCIYMLEGWESSRGAKLEFTLATELNIPVHYASEDYKYV